jgi:hypothetical protein
MDAELILLPKICDVRSHFRVSICDAILAVDRLKLRSGQNQRLTTNDRTPGNGASEGSWGDGHLRSGRDLPAALRWTNTEDHGFLPLQPRRMYTLLLHAWQRGQHGRLAKELKAPNRVSIRPAVHTDCGPFACSETSRGEADVRKQEAAPRHTFRTRRSGT